jgi:hypothetical protein
VCRVPHGDEAHHCRRSALSWSVSWHRGIVRASGPDRLPRSATFFPARGRVERLRPRRRPCSALSISSFNSARRPARFFLSCALFLRELNIPPLRPKIIIALLGFLHLPVTCVIRRERLCELNHPQILGTEG